MLHSGSDLDLVELATYLDCRISSEPAQTPNADIWGDAKFRIFLSHLSAEKLFASDVQSHLRLFGVSSFVAHEDIQPTEEWVNKIEAALASCDLLVALMHSGFHESKWTDQEIGFVLGRGVPAFSVRLGTDPYGFIGRFQAIPPGDGNARLVAQSIFEAALSNKKTESSAAECLVHSICSSRSWDMSNRLVGLLPKIREIKQVWPNQLADAFQSNYELTHAFAVPAALRTFFSRAGRDDLAASI
jgi:hypothetical protein